MSTLQRLAGRGLIRPPRWLPGNVQYETIMGSVAYGVSSDSSDLDVYGWAIPMKEDIFPHLGPWVVRRQHLTIADMPHMQLHPGIEDTLPDAAIPASRGALQH